MIVAIYCRVSTEDQAESKTIENQVEFAKKYCELHNLVIYQYYLDDGISGSTPIQQRPAGKRMLADAKEGKFDAVYVYRLDRLARTTLDILNTHDKLAKLSISLKSMTESFDTSTPSGKFFMTTLGGIAEIERATIAERMRLGKVRAIKEGRWPGGPPPYGYKIEHKHLVINEGEARVIKKIYQLYTEEGMDTVSVADYLTAAGYFTPGAARKKKSPASVWYGSKVWGILTNQTYAGRFVYGKSKTKGDQQEFSCPAIITEEQWNKAQQKLKDNYFNARRNAKRQYLLRGIIKCGSCGRNYCGDGSHSKGRHHYYRCTSNSSFRGRLVKKCSSRSVRADILESIVWKDILEFIKREDRLLKELQSKLIASVPGANTSEIDFVQDKINEKKMERDRVLVLFRKGLIDELEAQRLLEDVDNQYRLLQERSDKLRHHQEKVASLCGQHYSISNVSKLLGKEAQNVDVSTKRKLISLMVDSITVDINHENGKSVPRITINYCF